MIVIDCIEALRAPNKVAADGRMSLLRVDLDGAESSLTDLELVVQGAPASIVNLVLTQVGPLVEAVCADLFGR